MKSIRVEDVVGVGVVGGAGALAFKATSGMHPAARVAIVGASLGASYFGWALVSFFMMGNSFLSKELIRWGATVETPVARPVKATKAVPTNPAKPAATMPAPKATVVSKEAVAPAVASKGVTLNARGLALVAARSK